ncbi:hypothetical protein STEG23_018713 [Scotinomys teguina]
MYEPDPDLLAGQSAEEETEDSILSPIPMGPPSPFPTSEDFTPKEGSPYEAPVYIPEDIPIPPDFELRESSIPGAGLGIWAKRKMEVGERLGPYVVAPRAALKEADFGWEENKGCAPLNAHKVTWADYAGTYRSRWEPIYLYLWLSVTPKEAKCPRETMRHNVSGTTVGLCGTVIVDSWWYLW